MGSSFFSDWEILPLQDCMDAIIDYRGKTPEKTTFGIPLITAKIVKGGQIQKPEEFISVDDYDTWMRRGIPQPGDIILTTEAPLGEVAQLDDRKIALAQRLITLRGKRDILDNTFLKYLMQSDFVQEQLKARASGSTVSGIKQSELRKIDLLIPPLPTQHAIARILGSLDDKIELNRQMNETLEAMARAIFQSWFVDFDPVRAKAEGRDTGLPPEVAALFPSEMIEVDGREVPKGWGIKPLDQIAMFLNGLALQNYPPDGEDFLPVIKIAQLHKGDTEGSDRASMNIPSEYIIDDGDVLFSWSGSLEVVIWCGGKGALNQHLFKVTSDTFPKWFYYLWVLHHLADFQLIAEGKATTMGHIQRHHLSEAMVLVPSEKEIHMMNNMLEPLINKIITNYTESRTLAQIRDALLPKLMSGELRVGEN